MNTLKYAGLLVLLMVTSLCEGQSFKFAFVSDTHIGGKTADEDLQRTVNDINADSSLSFVLLTGDITEFGSDEELKLARSIIDNLNKPWYIVAGNHDSNWSESGSNSFRIVFGAETFAFTHGGYLLQAPLRGLTCAWGRGRCPGKTLCGSILCSPTCRIPPCLLFTSTITRKILP
ncbi:metallophosphoesterase family protein [Pontibacter rugosus]